MASDFHLSQSDVVDLDRNNNSHSGGAVDINPLSPPTLSRIDSESLAPSILQFDTPGDSHGASGYYNQSDYSDFDEDLFPGAGVNTGSPSFLEGEVNWDQEINQSQSVTPAPSHTNETNLSTTFPLTPDNTSSVHNASPHLQNGIPASISPHELHTPFNPPAKIPQDTSQLTPNDTNSGRSSVDGLAPAPPVMPIHSPRVTVSVYENGAPIHTTERQFDDRATTPRAGLDLAGDYISAGYNNHNALGLNSRDDRGAYGGYAPNNRSAQELNSSINDLANQRQSDERNESVGHWLNSGLDDVSAPVEKTAQDILQYDQPHEVDDGIPFAPPTVNRHVEGQTYVESNGGPMNETDVNILLADRNMGSGPALRDITEKRFQPESSQAAIERFERMYRDTESILSRAATWGTRRRSMPSIYDFDLEGVTSGNFLKKLSISRGNGDKASSKPGNIFNQIFRRPSISSMRGKRSRSASRGESPPHDNEQTGDTRRDSSPHLSPTSRTSSWNKKQTPSISTMIAQSSMSLASVGSTTHARSGSISGGSPLTSPKPSRPSLSVMNLRRPRSKSDLPKTSPGLTPGSEASSSLVEMWRKTGGPPVLKALSKGIPVEVDDEEDDDDDADLDDGDMNNNPNLINGTAPNFAGFREHLVKLNPDLDTKAGYLADRIAHQQTIRFKHLLKLKIKHLQLGANCICGTLCATLGGTARILDQRGGTREIDPLSSEIDGLDDGAMTEGAINQDSFPQDIPMPPTQLLPAEFECQLCFQRKKFLKPSDWTKHVHEDVQPFTCTWDNCKEPKIFKRKADWVRHENEGHRQLEWWQCNINGCEHKCHRKDNFLQHLVREHKLEEPKLKTKAAMKKAGAVEETWKKVDECHWETRNRPQDEPCRFCGRTFPTWKKLTVHLAKHMEQISLPVLKLVAIEAKKVAADTIISPVQDPPPRTSMLSFPTQAEMSMNEHFANQQRSLPPQVASHMAYNEQQPNGFIFSQANQLQQQFYANDFGSMNTALQQPPQQHLGNNAGIPVSQSFQHNQMMDSLGASSSGYLQPNNNYMSMNSGGSEPFPAMDEMSMQQVQAAQADNFGQMPMGYDNNMMAANSRSVNGSPFSGQESLSNYSHSPHMNNGNGNPDANAGWGDGANMRGF